MVFFMYIKCISHSVCLGFKGVFNKFKIKSLAKIKLFPEKHKFLISKLKLNKLYYGNILKLSRFWIKIRVQLDIIT